MLDFNLLEVKNEDHLVGLVMSDSKNELNKFMIKESYEKDVTKRNFVTRSLKAIQEKFFNTEFKMVIETKGDVKTLKGYKNIVTTLDIMNKTVKDAETRKQYIELKKCLENLEKYSRNFKLYFNLNDIVLSIYTTTVASLIAATSELAAQSFYFDIRSTGTIITPLKGKLSGRITIDSVISFNKMCADGSLNKLFSQVKNEIKTGSTTNEFLGQSYNKVKDFTMDTLEKAKSGANQIGRTVSDAYRQGSATTKVALVVAVSSLAIFVMREVVYYFYYFRNSISAYLENLADFVEMNATKNQSNNPKIRDKQLNIAEKMRNFANKVSAYNVTVERKIKEEISKEESQAKSEDQSSPADILL